MSQQPLFDETPPLPDGGLVPAFYLYNPATDCVLLGDWTWGAREHADEVLAFTSYVKARRVSRGIVGSHVVPW